MRISIWIALGVALAAASAAAQTPFPDLRGTWKGQSESIVAGTGNPHHAGPANSGPHPSSIAFTLTVDSQDGRRVSGTFSSSRSTESIIGVISNNGRIYFVDTDGYAFGTLSGPDRLEMCYLQIASYGRVASCTEMTKQR